MIRWLSWVLVAISIYCLSYFPVAVRPAAKDYPPPPWFRRYAAADLISAVPTLRRAEEFMLQTTRRGLPVYPSAWKLEDRVEIILQTWRQSRVIWNDSRARRAYDTPNGPFFHLLAQQAAESEFNRYAVSPLNWDSSLDLGLTQQNSRYLRQRGITDWRDIVQQITAQAIFMNYLLQQSSGFGGELARCAASAGYTAGPIWAERGVVPDIGRTREHVARIERFYQEMLTVPAPKPGARTYTVRQGDTLWRIAQRYKTTVTELVGKNHINDPDVIGVGQRLVIP